MRIKNLAFTYILTTILVSTGCTSLLLGPNAQMITPEIAAQLEDKDLHTCIAGESVFHNGKRIACSLPATSPEVQNAIQLIKTVLKGELFKRHPKWDQETKKLILEGKVRIGMPADQVLASWGKPHDVNRTVTAKTISEQWVYGNTTSRNYLYFKDGILTSWQD